MKVLIVGLGSIGQRHLRNLRHIFGAEIDVSAYRSIGRNIKISDDMTAQTDADLEDSYNIKIYTDYADALGQKPDTVIVANPTRLHLPTALEAAKQGCHFFIEKPISDGIDGISELQAIVKEKKLITLIGYQLRFHPCLELIRKLLDEGRIGQVINVHCEFGEYLPGAHPYEDYRTGYAARKDLGGGALLSLSHELDYLQWLFGMPDKLFALGGKLSGLEMDVDDTDSILMENKVNGKRVSIYIHLDFIQRPASRNCSIIGEEGKIFWDYYSNNVNLYTVVKKEWDVFNFSDFGRNNEFVEEIKYFIECVKEGRETKVDIDEGTKSLRIALAARRSIEAGAAVESI